MHDKMNYREKYFSLLRVLVIFESDMREEIIL